MLPLAKHYLDNAFNYFFPGDCFDKLLVQFDYMNQKCSPILLSRLLGVAITLGSTLILVPQILKIQSARSGGGISLIAQVLGLLAAAGNAAYSYEKGFVFGQWGDTLFVTIQTVLIVMQILYFSGAKAQAFAFMAFCWSTGLAVAHHYVPFQVLEFVQVSTGPIVVISKGVQIVQNYKQQSTGQLSVLSVGMQFGGCLARIFTSIQETGDKLIIGPYVLAAVLNGIILAQILYYGGGEKTSKSAKGKKKRN